MHQPISSPIKARFEFLPDRAKEFTFDDRLVVEMELETMDEVIEFTEQFKDALVDCNVLFNGAQVVNLSQFPLLDDK